MRVAVTGGLGFIGQEVVKYLIERGRNVIIVDRWKSVIPWYESERFPIIRSVYESIGNDHVQALMEPDEFLTWLPGNSSLDAIIHLGAVVDTMDMGESGDLFHDNVEFTSLLTKAADSDRNSEIIPGIVFASSAAVYGSNGSPNNPYGMTKSLGEKIVRRYRGASVCYRLFNVFGTLEHHKGAMASVPFKLWQAYKNCERFDLHSPDAKRDFVPVRSVAAAMTLSAEGMWSKKHYGSYTLDLGTGTATSFSDLDTAIMRATRSLTSCVRHVDVPANLVGRYQGYTCAGVRNSRAEIYQSTQDAIEELYGSREG